MMIEILLAAAITHSTPDQQTAGSENALACATESAARAVIAGVEEMRRNIDLNMTVVGVVQLFAEHAEGIDCRWVYWDYATRVTGGHYGLVRTPVGTFLAHADSNGLGFIVRPLVQDRWG